jgi:hypothetical protein
MVSLNTVFRCGAVFALSAVLVGCSKVKSDRIDSLTATTTESASGARITASPNPVVIKSGLGKTTIGWNTGDGSPGQVYVSRDGGPDTLVTQGAEGSDELSWIEFGPEYEFRLYAGLEHRQLLASVTIRGVRANQQGR